MSEINKQNILHAFVTVSLNEKKRVSEPRIGPIKRMWISARARFVGLVRIVVEVKSRRLRESYRSKSSGRVPGTIPSNSKNANTKWTANANNVAQRIVEVTARLTSVVEYLGWRPIR